jgi:hypothetical protein
MRAKILNAIVQHPTSSMTTVANNLSSPSVDKLATLVEEGIRANKKSVGRFLEPAPGTLRRAKSKRHHIVFGRRGSGKSSLLYKSCSELSKDGHVTAYVDLEPFKGHHYPDLLISVLIASFTKYYFWIKTFYFPTIFHRILCILTLLDKKQSKQASELLDALAKEIIDLR